MDDFRVPTTSLPVEIHGTNGQHVLGEIFLPAQSSLQPGPMRPDEWSDTVHAFFPFRSRETDGLAILNRDTVVAITVPASANADEGELWMDSPICHVAVEAGGQRYEGDILVDTPPGHQRVADWLNAPGAFITVRSGLAHHLIHKRHVTRVVELDRIRS